MKIGFAYFLGKDVRFNPLPRGVVQAARSMSSSVIAKFCAIWSNIIYFFLGALINCKRPCNTHEHSYHVQAVICNIKGLDLYDDIDDDRETLKQDAKDRTESNMYEAFLFDLSMSIQLMKAFFPEFSSPTAKRIQFSNLNTHPSLSSWKPSPLPHLIHHWFFSHSFFHTIQIAKLHDNAAEVHRDWRHGLQFQEEGFFRRGMARPASESMEFHNVSAVSKSHQLRRDFDSKMLGVSVWVPKRSTAPHACSGSSVH